MKLSPDVLDVLASATTDGNALRLTGQLDRKLYAAVNKALEAAGGTWNRKAQAHLFPEPAGPILDALLAEGKVATAQDEGWFPTPPVVVAQMLTLAGLEPGMMVLEPSAGDGAIAGPATSYGCWVDCVELNAKRAAALRAAGFVRSVADCDFLTVVPHHLYDRVMMNPPFARQADIRHVTHALGFVKPGGRVVAVMSAGVEFRQDKTTGQFRKLVADRGGWFEQLPEDAFKGSGTNIRTVLAVIPC